MGPALIDLVDLGKTYPGVVPVTALKAVNLVINEGDFTAITGPSGSGKSTLLNVLGLLDRPTDGSYRFAGTELADAPDRVRIGYRGHRFGFVFQAFHLLGSRTAMENVELGQLYTEPRTRVRRSNALQALENLGIGHKAHAYPAELSGGEKQRVAIARALSGDPMVLFCDEPTGNLDSANAELVMQALMGLNRQGLTIVLVTHDTLLAKRAPRRLAVADGLVERIR